MQNAERAGQNLNTFASTLEVDKLQPQQSGKGWAQSGRGWRLVKIKIKFERHN